MQTRIQQSQIKCIVYHWLNMSTTLTIQLDKLQQIYPKFQDLRYDDQDKTQDKIEQMGIIEHDTDIDDIYPETMIKQKQKKKKQQTIYIMTLIISKHV